MAPKRPLGNPPPTNSDEEDSSDEEVEEEQPVEEEEEEEEEEPPAKKPASEPEAAESDDQSDSDVDSDKTPNTTDFTIKPIVSKTHSAKPNTPTSKKRPKRSVEIPTSPESSKKKKKKLSESSGVLGKRGAVQRVWSDDDEIAILKGMIEFESKKGSDPCTDIVGFHAYIKDSVHVDVSNHQLKDKIRRMRNKYQNNAVKGGNNGEDPVFSKPHEYMSFQLSKARNGEKSKGDGVLSSYPSLKKSLDLMPENLRDLSSNLLCSVESSKVKELDQDWKEINKKEFELHLIKTQLFLDMTKAVGFNQGNK